MSAGKKGYTTKIPFFVISRELWLFVCELNTVNCIASIFKRFGKSVTALWSDVENSFMIYRKEEEDGELASQTIHICISQRDRGNCNSKLHTIWRYRFYLVLPSMLVFQLHQR